MAFNYKRAIPRKCYPLETENAYTHTTNKAMNFL